MRSAEYAEVLFADPVHDRATDSFAQHSYWSNRRHKREFTAWFNATYPDKTISMTEYCQMEGVYNPGMDGGLHLARVMHDDLTVGSVVSWQWWLAIATGGYADGLIYAHPRTKKIETTKRLWVMGHYARFVEPGYQRVSAEVEGEAVLATAYRSPDGDALVVVLINEGDDAYDLAIETAASRGEVKGCWVTNEQMDLEPQTVGDGRVKMPARLMMTVVLGGG